MSLHAQISPEAQARLEAQKRNSTISSVVIAVLSLVVLGLLLGLFLLPNIEKPKPPVIYTYPPKKVEPPKPAPREKPVVRPNPTPPANRPANFLNAPDSAIHVPVVEVTVTEPSLELGSGDEFGNDFGDFDVFTRGDSGRPIPDVVKNRCDRKLRLKRLREVNGPIESEAAVSKALDWLQDTQNPDGSWGNQYQSAMTGFALLAYLGRCETPESRQYGRTVAKGMTYLIDLGMKNDGKLTVIKGKGHQWVYEHAIATYALAEATSLCKGMKNPIPNLEEVTKMAGEIIADGQADSGGWNYNYANSSSQGDNSVGFWQIQALKACSHTGLWPKTKFKGNIRDAHDFLEKVQGQDGAIGYRISPSKSPHLTGGGVLCFQIWGEGNKRAAKKGVEWVRENTKFEWGKESANLYYHYYNAQAMMNAGGDDWDWYNQLFSKSLLDAQNPDGSWTQTMRHGPINQHMATCLATLTLEVYYRFLPGTH
ncbi:MAG: prenyltransferase/squalene oxidase repeat-containing protein [Akkermansiaceae bacterium]|nr:prenyltransferase/squalene oxidase repeat-containing protein [Akkermansiaceae bacterium]